MLFAFKKHALWQENYMAEVHGMPKVIYKQYFAWENRLQLK